MALYALPSRVAEYFAANFPGQPVSVVRGQKFTSQAEVDKVAASGPTAFVECTMIMENQGFTVPKTASLTQCFITCGQVQFA